MFFWNSSSVAANTIGELLKKEDVTLTEVLMDSSLSASLRSSNKDLMEYVKKDDVLKELIDLAITESYKDEKYKDENFKEKGNKLSRLALTVFINSSFNFQQSILQNDTFIKELNNFMESGTSDSFLIGHFQRIIETYSRSDNDFINKLSNLLDYLHKNISSLGISELLVFLISEIQAFQNAMDYDKNVKPLVNLVKEKKEGYYAISTIDRIIKKSDTFKNILRCDDALNILLDAVVAEDADKLVSSIIFDVIADVFCENEYQKIIDERCNDYNFENNCALSGALSVFKVIPENVWGYVFRNEVSTFVLQSIQFIFERMSNEQIAEMLKQKIDNETVLEKIRNYTKTNIKDNKTDGVMINIAYKISDLNENELKNESDWINFCQEELKKYIDEREKKENDYGLKQSLSGDEENSSYDGSDGDEDYPDDLSSDEDEHTSDGSDEGFFNDGDD